MWENKRFHSLSYELKKEFGEKIYKVSLDASFTCPNRDGTLSYDGCIFCNEEGSGEHGGDRKDSITTQINKGIEKLSGKFSGSKVIAYFQNFTNTYGDIAYLRRIYYEALSHKKVVGIAIATRPDCIDNEILDLLKEINKNHYLWIEFGLQSVHEKSERFVNRGYSINVFEEVYSKIRGAGIKSVIHLIAGLPTESKDEFLENILYLNNLKVWGIKIHLLYIIKGTKLERYYLDNPFNIFSFEEYVELLVEVIGKLNKDIVIHRLTGDGTRETLIKPTWSLSKRKILNTLDQTLKKRNIYQGSQQ